MSRWYNIEMVLYRSIVVEVDDDADEDEALTIAWSEYQPDESTAKELVTEVDIDRAKRYADETFTL